MNSQISEDPLLGAEVGGYRVDSLLGQGGMAKVYRATGPDGCLVALKFVRGDYARDETFRRRFSREARIAQTVKHRNVVPVLATGEHQGIPYMAQRFIAGCSLDERIKRDGRLDVTAAVQVCSQVAAGLEALWAAGMVHRDVKPANILISDSGQAHITDFGLAKDTRGSVLTLPGQALGSMDYMPPEQIRGEPLTAAADIYALGCVMYECMCGRPPFAHVEGMRILWAHLQDDPPDPREIRSDLPEEFSTTLLTALEKDCDRRPASAGDYARMLGLAAGMPSSDTFGREPSD
jgi:serine/threonine protein kinase